MGISTFTATAAPRTFTITLTMRLNPPTIRRMRLATQLNANCHKMIIAIAATSTGTRDPKTRLPSAAALGIPSRHP